MSAPARAAPRKRLTLTDFAPYGSAEQKQLAYDPDLHSALRAIGTAVEDRAGERWLPVTTMGVTRKGMADAAARTWAGPAARALISSAPGQHLRLTNGRREEFLAVRDPLTPRRVFVAALVPGHVSHDHDFANDPYGPVPILMPIDAADAADIIGTEILFDYRRAITQVREQARHDGTEIVLYRNSSGVLHASAVDSARPTAFDVLHLMGMQRQLPYTYVLPVTTTRERPDTLATLTDYLDAAGVRVRIDASVAAVKPHYQRPAATTPSVGHGAAAARTPRR